MNKHRKVIDNTEDAWDLRELGADIESAVESQQNSAEIDAALALQMISIRLPIGLLEDLKVIAQINGIGYQPLIRKVLQRFAIEECKKLMADYANKIARGEIAPEKDAEKRCA